MISSEIENNFDIMPLYRYQSCPYDDPERMEWIRQILVNHQLYFTSRKLFNDPFDCVVPSFQQIPGTIIKKFSEEFVDRKFNEYSETEKDKLISELMSAKALENIRKRLQDDIDKAGIVCFSKERDDILMWAHYADKHKGICFEYDGSDNCLFFGEAQPVGYDNYTQIPLGKDKERQMSRVILTRKNAQKTGTDHGFFSKKRGQTTVFLALPETTLSAINRRTKAFSRPRIAACFFV